MSELERQVTEMAAAAESAYSEADQLKTDLRNQQTLFVGNPCDRAHAPDARGMHRKSTACLGASTPDRDLGNLCLASARIGELVAATGYIPDTTNLVPADARGGRLEEEEKEVDVTTTTACGNRGEAPASPSTLSLAAAEQRTASAEKALLEARSSSQTALEQARLLEQQLKRVRAAARDEAEGKRIAHARISELERDIHLMEHEQEAIRARAESRLESLREAFEQEELEAGGKVG